MFDFNNNETFFRRVKDMSVESLRPTWKLLTSLPDWTTTWKRLVNFFSLFH